MAPTEADRNAAITELGAVLGERGAELFDKALPTEPWIDVLDPRIMRHPDFIEYYAGPERHELWSIHEELIGTDHAATLMEFLLPVPHRLLARLSRELDVPLDWRPSPPATTHRSRPTQRRRPQPGGSNRSPSATDTGTGESISTRRSSSTTSS